MRTRIIVCTIVAALAMAGSALAGIDAVEQDDAEDLRRCLESGAEEPWCRRIIIDPENPDDRSGGLSSLQAAIEMLREIGVFEADVTLPPHIDL